MTDRSELRKLASERIDAAFKIAWAKKEADGYRYGQDALEGVRFGFEIAYEDLLDQLDRAEAECVELRKEHDSLVEATVLGPLKGKTAHDEIIGLRAQLSACRAALGEACDIADEGNEELAVNNEDGENCAITRERIKVLRSVGQPK